MFATLHRERALCNAVSSGNAVAQGHAETEVGSGTFETSSQTRTQLSSTCFLEVLSFQEATSISKVFL